jgi:hypothetical protein
MDETPQFMDVFIIVYVFHMIDAQRDRAAIGTTKEMLKRKDSCAIT